MRQKTILAGVAGLLAVSGNVRWNQVTAQTEPHRVEIKAKRFNYQPSELTLKKGEPVILVLKSEDVPHGLRFRDLNIALRVDKGGSSEMEFTPTQAGDFRGQCWVFCGAGHGSMMLTLHVVN